MKKILSALALTAVAVGAHAQLTFAGGTADLAINGYNPTGTTSPQTQGLVDATISATTAGTLTATFLGYEARDNDQYGFAFSSGFLANGNSATPSAIGATISGPVGAGPLTFTFTDLTSGESVGNGGNPSTAIYSSYAILGTFAGSVFTPYHGSSGQYELVLGFNDGLRVDADYDDMVVGLVTVGSDTHVTPVPEPETYALMLAGLGAIGFIGRRRRKS